MYLIWSTSYTAERQRCSVVLHACRMHCGQLFFVAHNCLYGVTPFPRHDLVIKRETTSILRQKLCFNLICPKTNTWAYLVNCLHFILTNQVACNCFDVNVVHEEYLNWKFKVTHDRLLSLIIVTNYAGREKTCNLRLISCIFSTEKTVPVERMWVLYLALKGLLGSIKVLKNFAFLNPRNFALHY